MKTPRFTWPRLLLALAGLTLLLLPLVAWLDYVSLERANRLYRDGAHIPAIRIYRKLAQDESVSPVVRYNLGTAWRSAGSPSEAESSLRLAADAGDPEVRFRASFNLGYVLMGEAFNVREREMAAPLLGEAVLAYREALRMRPDSEAARWNLGVAMAALDSVAMRQVAGRPRVPTRADPVLDEERSEEAGTLADMGRSGEEGGEDGGEADLDPAERRQGSGARETLAEEVGGIPGDEVSLILASVPDDPSHLMRRILWLEGPKGWFGSGQPSRAGRW